MSDNDAPPDAPPDSLDAGPDPRPIEPVDGPLDADVTVPGSKSATNRALLVAAMAGGASRLRGALASDDTWAMVDCLRRCGVAIDVHENRDEIEVLGRTVADVEPIELDARQSGTTARFVAPYCALDGRRYVLDGSEQLRSRPMGPGLDALTNLGATVISRHEPGRLPVEITGPLTGTSVRLPGDVSSQFVSGLLMVAPLLPDGLMIELTTAPVSRPYLDLTVSVMTAFGGFVHVDGDRRYVVRAGRYVGRDILIEPDASAASYFFAAAAVCGGRVRVEGLGRNTVQGDLAFVELLERMGATVRRGATWTEVVGTGELHGVEADMADLSDTAPTLAVVAAFADTPTRVTGIGFIRGKETDRIAAVVTELRRLGIDAVDEPDGFSINPGPITPAVVETYRDHRMAMSFAIAGLRVPGIAIADPVCVAKTFPTFWTALDGLRPSGRQ